MRDDTIYRDMTELDARVRAIKQRVNTHTLESDDPIAVALLGTDRLMKLHIPEPRRRKQRQTEVEIGSRFAVNGSKRRRWSKGMTNK